MSTSPHDGWHFGRRIVLPMALFLAAAIAFALVFMAWATERADALSVEREIRTTRRALDDTVARLAQEQEIAAVRDDAVVQLARPALDWRWLDDNFGIWYHDVFGHDLVFILDARDRPIYAAVGGTRVAPERWAEFAPSLGHAVDVVRGRLREPDGRFDRLPGAVTGDAVLTTPKAIHETELALVVGRPAAVSAMRIRPSTDRLPLTPGREPLLINVRYLGAGFLAELERRNLVHSPRFSWRADAAPGEQSIPLVSDGNFIGHLVWRPALPGSALWSLLVQLTIAMTALIILLLGWLAHRLWGSTRQLTDTVSRLRESETQASRLAVQDPLTGLPNRALLEERLDLALAHRDRRVALLLIDLDRFKNVNDTFGHLAGDALIRELGRRLSRLVRRSDTVGRLGGDEFAIVMEGVERPGDVERLARRVLAAVSEPFDAAGQEVYVGASIGILHCEPGTGRTEALRRVDIALYRAKEEGKGCWRLFDEEMDAGLRFRRAIEVDLRAALAEDSGLCVHFQPQYDVAGAVVGAEALVRWQHPEHGLIGPEQFVPVAEETGLIDPLGRAVLRRACALARRWPGLFFAVNMSPLQFRVPGFADGVIANILAEGVDPAQIEVEVTENAFLDDNEQVRDALRTLRAAGVRIALDDFGTGYSSLAYLRRFRFDKIKIDRTFISNLDECSACGTIIAAVVAIGRALGISVTAEGVETPEHKDILETAGCQYLQGHLFSEALPEDRFEALLAAAAADRRAVA